MGDTNKVKSFTKGLLSLTLTIGLSYGLLQAWEGLTATTGDSLTAEKWNNFITRLETLESGHDLSYDADGITQSVPVTHWKDQDANCDLEDITIGDQIWAGCNSTLGTTNSTSDSTDGIHEYNTDNRCYNYAGASNGGTSCYGYNTKESNYDATNGVDNIWGKLYGANAAKMIACGEGYHLPTDAEFELLETTLNGGTNCRNATDGWLCDGLGWSGNKSKDSTNNIIKALKLPLVGFRKSNGAYYNRGINTYLWSSSDVDVSNVRGRVLNWDDSTVARGSRSVVFGFSVRCIKD